MHKYYNHIFLSEGVDQGALQQILLSIQPQVLEEMNGKLCAAPTKEEIQTALFAMALLKSPGLDGLPPAFFQKYWDVTQEDLFTFVHDFFTKGQLPSKLKVATKIMANRLKEVMDLLISPTQSAFIPNRSISDNVFVAYEIFNYINHKKKGKKRFLALKLDMKKANDRVEWVFLEQFLLQFGFSTHWVQMVMSSLKFVSYKLIINGGIRERLYHRGALSSIISTSESSGLLRGIQASGQAVNLRKSSLSFSPNTPLRFRQWFSCIVKFSCGKSPSIYLGLPTEFGLSKSILFKDISNKTGKQLSSWKQQLLSYAGKEVMLKSIVFSMANYACSHFKLPSSQHDCLGKAAINFFWGDGSDKRKIHWISWLRLCQSKEKGGLGF
ncbi:uncharacterized protein LOC122645078 [Telopea speciosissima]|uniref:uncharacterized protein LOC122645078 n=1 Tax=Telopea speciosissima TaxID=54955 RepID=UPI001CC36931|nr:uncharacterized protein LOC122645078 [Telopea speciosissima]